MCGGNSQISSKMQIQGSYFEFWSKGHHISFYHESQERSQDGGGIGQGDHFLFYKFIERTTERWTKFIRQLLIISSGYQAPRKAAHCIQRKRKKIVFLFSLFLSFIFFLFFFFFFFLFFLFFSFFFSFFSFACFSLLFPFKVL